MKGIIELTAAKLIKNSKAIEEIKPITNNLAKSSGAAKPILKPLKTKSRKKIIKITEPRKPNSSPITAKIESVITSGINVYDNCA